MENELTHYGRGHSPLLRLCYKIALPSVSMSKLPHQNCTGKMGILKITNKPGELE
jgi:hypothetical protein